MMRSLGSVESKTGKTKMPPEMVMQTIINHLLTFICSSSSFAQAIEKSFKAQTITLARTVAEDENVK